MEGTPINPMSARAPEPPRAAPPTKAEQPKARDPEPDRVELDDLSRAGERLLEPSSRGEKQSIDEIFELAERVRDASVEYLRQVVLPPPPDGTPTDRADRVEAHPSASRESSAAMIVEEKPKGYSGGRGAIDLVA